MSCGVLLACAEWVFLATCMLVRTPASWAIQGNGDSRRGEHLSASWGALAGFSLTCTYPPVLLFTSLPPSSGTDFPGCGP